MLPSSKLENMGYKPITEIADCPQQDPTDPDKILGWIQDRKSTSDSFLAQINPGTLSERTDPEYLEWLHAMATSLAMDNADANTVHESVFEHWASRGLLIHDAPTQMEEQDRKDHNRECAEIRKKREERRINEVLAHESTPVEAENLRQTPNHLLTKDEKLTLAREDVRAKVGWISQETVKKEGTRRKLSAMLSRLTLFALTSTQLQDLDSLRANNWTADTILASAELSTSSAIVDAAFPGLSTFIGEVIRTANKDIEAQGAIGEQPQENITIVFNEEWVSKAEAMERLQISREKIDAMAKTGEITTKTRAQGRLYYSVPTMADKELNAAETPLNSYISIENTPLSFTAEVSSESLNTTSFGWQMFDLRGGISDGVWESLKRTHKVGLSEVTDKPIKLLRAHCAAMGIPLRMVPGQGKRVVYEIDVEKFIHQAYLAAAQYRRVIAALEREHQRQLDESMWSSFECLEPLPPKPKPPTPVQTTINPWLASLPPAGKAKRTPTLRELTRHLETLRRALPTTWGDARSPMLARELKLMAEISSRNDLMASAPHPMISRPSC